MTIPISGSRTATAAVLVLALVASLLGGCATTEENGSGKTGRIVGTTIGALAGGIIGAREKGKEGAVVGALAGGAAGYAIGWLVDEYIVKRTKTARQVRARHGVPEGRSVRVEPAVHQYAVAINPDAFVNRGGRGEAITTFDLVAAEGADLTVQEECAIVTPDGRELLRKRYDYGKHVTEAGGYEFRRALPVPEQAGQGRYAYTSRLFVNGKETGRADNGFRVAAAGTAMARLFDPAVGPVP